MNCSMSVPLPFHLTGLTNGWTHCPVTLFRFPCFAFFFSSNFSVSWSKR